MHVCFCCSRLMSCKCLQRKRALCKNVKMYKCIGYAKKCVGGTVLECTAWRRLPSATDTCWNVQNVQDGRSKVKSLNERVQLCST